MRDLQNVVTRERTRSGRRVREPRNMRRERRSPTAGCWRKIAGTHARTQETPKKKKRWRYIYLFRRENEYLLRRSSIQ